MSTTPLRVFLAVFGVLLAGVWAQQPAQSQSITTDNGTPTILNGGAGCPGGGNCSISGGTATSGGANLFHTFQTFNVGTGTTAEFVDPTPGTTENIIGQVTVVNPSNISSIDGTLSVSGVGSMANLFLLNPNGIVFGPNAALSVPGSFVASTGESVVFDSNLLNSGDPSIVPLLTFSTSVGVQMGANPGDITVSDSFLTVSNGQSLNLIGNNVRLDTGAALQVAGPSGGSIQLQATDTLTLTDRSTVQIVLTGAGTGDDRLFLRAPNISLLEGAQASIFTTGSGVTGEINVEAETLSLDSGNATRPSSLLSATFGPATGAGADINVTADTISLTNGGEIGARAIASGNAGNVSINAQLVEVNGFNAGGASRIVSTSESPTAGPGGQVAINTAQLRVIGGGQVATSTISNSAAGNLSVTASESVTLEGNVGLGRSGLFANALFQGGAGGSVTVNTPSLVLRDGATINVGNTPSGPISTAPAGSGPAGSIDIQNANTVILDNSILTANTVNGTGANISLQANGLLIRNGSLISTNATGTATGGNINLDLGVLLGIENSDITANAVNNFGGNVTLVANAIFGDIAFRAQENPATSDITATSELGADFSGVVILQTPDVDPLQIALALSEAVASDEKVTAACGAVQGNTFVASGRGGLPQNANQLLQGQSLWQDQRLASQAADRFSDQPSTDIISTSGHSPVNASHSDSISAENQLVEAQGWQVQEDGQVQLFASAPNNASATQLVDCLG